MTQTLILIHMRQGWYGRLIRYWIPVVLMTSSVYSRLVWDPVDTFSSVIQPSGFNAMKTFNVWYMVWVIWESLGGLCID